MNLSEFGLKTYKELGLDAYEIKGLKTFLEEKGYSRALCFGLDSLNATHFVGSIKYHNIQIDIYPKYLTKDEADTSVNREKSIQQLIKMLAYTCKLDIETSSADSEKNKNSPFLEVLIYFYAKSLFESLKKHNPHHYQDREENLNTIRGRINFAKNIKYNFANKSKIFCNFQEFTSDNLLNRTLYFVSHLLYRKTQNEESKKNFKQIFAIYDDITLMPITIEQTKKIRLSKQQQKFFSTPFKIAQMFLEHSSINLYNNTLKDFAILFDMDKLFEEFVYEKLTEEYKENTHNYAIESQKSKCLIEGFTPVIEGENNLAIDKKKYIRTDILIKQGNKISNIIDTKYKDAERISSSDIYQMVAYARIYKETKNLILIYPCQGTPYQCRTIFCKDIEEDLNLQVITIDLTQEIEKIQIKELFTCE